MIVEKISDEQLERIPVLEGMKPEERRQLAGIATVKQARAGEVLVHQGRQSQELWIILDGACEVIREVDGPAHGHEQFVLALIGPREHFGEMSFFQPAPHSASVRARTEATLLQIEHSDYQELIQGECHSAYKLTYNVVNSLAERLRRMDQWVAELLGRSRVAPPEKEAPPQRRSEWNAFRDKLFSGWNL